MIKCKRCGISKPESDFYKNAATKSGLTGKCKPCYYRKTSMREERKENPLKFMLYNAKHRAKLHNIPFTLTENNIPMPTHCPIFGIELIYGGSGTNRGYGAKPEAASIDRIDPKKGYTPENSIIISWKANRTKALLTVDELILMAEFYKHLVACNKS
jgi:hypothetical protein